jgi:surface antigen
MGKTKTLALCITLALASTSSHAESGGSLLDQFQQGLTSENIGKAVGAAAGALLGSQVGKGRGRLAAVAIGTLAGYWVGGNIARHLSSQDQVGIAETTEKALETNQDQSWRNPETGVYTKVSVRDDDSGYTANDATARLQQAPPLELINAFKIANANVNVRGGPSTDYAILHTLAHGAKVPVVGKVVGKNWYMIAEQGRGNGFVYAPLLADAAPTLQADNAIRANLLSGEQPPTYAVRENQCRIITQQVSIPQQGEETHEFKACKQADGSWVEV